MKKTIILSLAALAMISAIGCGKKEEAVAVVNGESISKEDFFKHMSKMQQVRINTGSGVANAPVAEPLDFQALQEMIAQKALIQLAKDEGVYPDEAKIMAELEFRKKLNEQYVKQLTTNGFTLSQIKENITLDLARDALLTRGITVTKEETDKFIADNPEQFTDPATVDMLWVFVKTETKKAQVDSELKSGQAFSAVASRYSDFEGAQEAGGRFPQRVVNQMQAPLQNLVNKTGEGRTSDWLQLSDGWAKFFVQSKTAAKKRTLNDDQKEAVRRELAKQRATMATDLNKKVLTKLADSKITVDDKVMKEAWERAFERLQKEAEQMAPSAGGAMGAGGESLNPAAGAGN